MMHVVLIGMMGCGKSTAGMNLAQRLGLDLVDTDFYIECREGRTIPQIFAQEGEEYFRFLEIAVGQELGQMSPMVVACGGGLPMQPRAMTPLKMSGHIVYLRRDPFDIYENTSMEGRPLGQDGLTAFLDRYREREPIYKKWADQVVEVGATPDDTLEEILGGLPWTS